MFSITLTLVLFGVYTCYGETHRSAAAAAQYRALNFLPKDPFTHSSTSSPPVPPEKALPLEPVYNEGYLHAIEVKPVKEPDPVLRSQSIPPASTLPPLFAKAVQAKLLKALDQETITNPFKGPPYLPPLNAWKVPPLPPENLTKEDMLELQRSKSYSNKTKRPSVGPVYLPATKPYKTLKLEDLKKEPRPWWHVGIYTKTTEPYKQICGGSVVRPDVVISAAHCFWADDIGLLPAKHYAVAGDKVYRPWNDTHDKSAQKSNVSDIKVPPRFRGGKTSFQDDLAVVRLETPFRYTSGLRPVCVDFDEAFNKQQLRKGNWGVVAGWGYTDELGTPAQQLLWIELPYVEINQCIRDAEESFLKYITSDKICAGEAKTSRTLCKGDSGGGLAFWAGEPWDFAPMLRGVGSAASGANNKECNLHTVPAFTQIASHKTFLLEHVPLLDLDCPFRLLSFGY